MNLRSIFKSSILRTANKSVEAHSARQSSSKVSEKPKIEIESKPERNFVSIFSKK